MIHRNKLASWGGGAVALAGLLLCGLGAVAQPKPASLRLLRQVSLPKAGSVATDVRWAGDDSVYVSLSMHGVIEVGLGGEKRRVALPDLSQINFRINEYRHLAVSSKFLTVAATGFGMAWRPRQSGAGGDFGLYHQNVPIASDVDVHGNRALLLGNPVQEREKRLQSRGYVWLGTLSEKGFVGFKPVLRAKEAPVQSLYHCQDPSVGAARFFADGSFVVAPGFEDGVHLFDAAGKKVRSWSSGQIGVDTHKICARMTMGDFKDLSNPAVSEKWFKQQRMIDDVLPLPQGPGIVVRTWENGLVHWTLKVLRSEGISTYELPLTSRRVQDRLKADVRNGQIALLLSYYGYGTLSQDKVNQPSGLFLVEAPK